MEDFIEVEILSNRADQAKKKCIRIEQMVGVNKAFYHIGSGDCEIKFERGVEIEDVHAVLKYEHGNYFLADRCSKQGTYLQI